MMQTEFDIPIVLFTFKRSDKTLEVLDRIATIKPKKLYILSDQGRNDDEKKIVAKLRANIEARVNWGCELIRNYASENRGVYENIGMGSKWVLEQESSAIFLEDDNLPDLSFFNYCKELLHKYKENEKILWICGTNYLEQYETENNESYVFTSHMLPCGWASWSDKFLKFYDGELASWEKEETKKMINQSSGYKPLLSQDYGNWDRELSRIKRGLKPDSWDYQMALSIKANNLLGIAPKYNLINNIGVDMDSIHGGNSLELEMTRRFCNIPTKSLEFPLIHPNEIKVDAKFELITAKIITLPLNQRLKGNLAKIIKRILNLQNEESILPYLKSKLNFKK